MVTKVHVLPLSKAFPLYLENVLCHIQLKCLEKRENLETLGMYVGGGAFDQISWKVLLAVCNISILKFGSNGTRSSNAIQYIMSQTSWLNMMLSLSLSLSLSQS
jgi:hypothetical protein